MIAESAHLTEEKNESPAIRAKNEIVTRSAKVELTAHWQEGGKETKPIVSRSQTAGMSTKKMLALILKMMDSFQEEIK